ncbi:hypothetical protein JTB14_023243 [Gonioctena quinquepunctata]|nr:hypothetical protein JTB14_023243 [Gonioctena quinquepunctata]
MKRCEIVCFAESADSGHMKFYRELFSQVKPLAHLIAIQIGDNSVVYAECVESIEVFAVIDDRRKLSALENNMHIQKLGEDLRSAQHRHMETPKSCSKISTCKSMAGTIQQMLSKVCREIRYRVSQCS